MRERYSETRAQTTVVASVLIVALTLTVAAAVLVVTDTFETPDPDDAIPELGPSPFSEERVTGSFVGEADERALYDSTADEVLTDDPNDGAALPPPDVDGAVASTVEALEGSPAPPGTPEPGEDDVRVPSGDYYIGGWYSHINADRIVFDTSDGPVRVAVSEWGHASISPDVAVEGSHPVEFYVERAAWSSGLRFDGVEADGHQPHDLRVYGQSDEAGDSSYITVSSSEFHGVVYAPGSTEVEVHGSEFYGAAVAGETDLEGSSYYHDTALEYLGEDVLP